MIAAAVFSVGGMRAYAELAATSPFLPPAGQSVMVPTAGAPLEFRGVTTSGGTTRFSIFDPSKKSGTWIGLNESGYDFAVKKYDADADTVTVDYQGRTLTLAMRTPKVASLGNAVASIAPPVPMIAPIPAPIAGAAPQPNLVARSVTATATPAAEAARLADWQAEIQRRRDMRAQTLTQPQTGQQTQPQVQAVPQPQNNPQRQNGGGGGQRRRN